MQVVLHGLGSRADLNGAIGQCVSYAAEAGRYNVALANGELLALRPANVAAAPGRPQQGLLEKAGHDMKGRDVRQLPCRSLSEARSIAALELQGKGSDWFASYCSQRKQIWIKTGADSNSPYRNRDKESVTLLLADWTSTGERLRYRMVRDGPLKVLQVLPARDGLLPARLARAGSSLDTADAERISRTVCTPRAASNPRLCTSSFAAEPASFAPLGTAARQHHVDRPLARQPRAARDPLPLARRPRAAHDHLGRALLDDALRPQPAGAAEWPRIARHVHVCHVHVHVVTTGSALDMLSVRRWTISSPPQCSQSSCRCGGLPPMFADGCRWIHRRCHCRRLPAPRSGKRTWLLPGCFLMASCSPLVRLLLAAELGRGRPVRGVVESLGTLERRRGGIGQQEQRAPTRHRAVDQLQLWTLLVGCRLLRDRLAAGADDADHGGPSPSPSPSPPHTQISPSSTPSPRPRWTRSSCARCSCTSTSSTPT